jgi:hypothetical protein
MSNLISTVDISSKKTDGRRPREPIGCYRSLLNTSVFNLTPGSAIARITQALLQHGPCEAAAASAPLLSATAELPFCQDGSFPFRARHPRRLCSCESKSKNQAAHRVRKVRQVVGNGGSVRVLFAVAVAWLCAPMSAGSSAQYQTPATPRVVIQIRAWYLCWQRWSAVSVWPGMRDSPKKRRDEREPDACRARRQGTCLTRIAAELASSGHDTKTPKSSFGSLGVMMTSFIFSYRNKN